MAPVGAIAGGLAGGLGIFGGAGGAAAALSGASLGSSLGGLAGGLLGGGGESEEARVQRIESLTDEQKLLLSLSTEEAIKEFERKRPKFKKETVVPATKFQKQIFGEAKKQLPQVAKLPQRALAAYETQVAEPARQAFLEQTAPRLAARFNELDALSSSAFQRQTAQQARQLEQELARQKSNVQFQAQQQQVPQLSSLLGLAGIERDIAQQQRAGELQKFTAEEISPSPAFSLVGNPLGVRAYENLAFAPQPSAANPLLSILSQQGTQSLLSGGLGGGGLGGLLGGGGGLGGLLGGLGGLGGGII